MGGQVALVRHLDLNLRLAVVDLVKDPRATGSLTRSTTRIFNIDEALVCKLRFAQYQ